MDCVETRCSKDMVSGLLVPGHVKVTAEFLEEVSADESLNLTFVNGLI